MRENGMLKEQIKVREFVKDTLEDTLGEVALECLRNIKSTLVVLNNSFVTITNKDLVVLKCLISKNSNRDMTNYLPLLGSCLKDKVDEKNAILHASIRNETSQIKNNQNSKKSIANLESTATPIKYKNNVIGYISLTTINHEISNVASIFIESLSLNIENVLGKVFIENSLMEYIDLVGAKPNAEISSYLSSKEKLISKYMLASYSNIEIANILCISESTVKTYLRRIYEKCGTSNRVDTTIFIICNNILHIL